MAIWRASRQVMSRTGIDDGEGFDSYSDYSVGVSTEVGGVSISAFQNRMIESATGSQTQVVVRDGDREGVFSTQRSLETFADVEISLF